MKKIKPVFLQPIPKKLTIVKDGNRKIIYFNKITSIIDTLTGIIY